MERATQHVHILQQAKQWIVVEQPSGTGELALSSMPSTIRSANYRE